MIHRWILHVEFHRGYWWPQIRLRRAPRAGDIVWEGMTPHRLERCEPCSGDGFLAREIRHHAPEEPEDQLPRPWWDGARNGRGEPVSSCQVNGCGCVIVLPHGDDAWKHGDPVLYVQASTPPHDALPPAWGTVPQPSSGPDQDVKPEQSNGWPNNRTCGQLGLCGDVLPGAAVRSGDPLAGLPVAEPWTPALRVEDTGDQIATATERSASWAVRGKR